MKLKCLIVWTLVNLVFVFDYAQAYTFKDALRDSAPQQAGLHESVRFMQMVNKVLTQAETDPATDVFLNFWIKSIADFNFDRLYKSNYFVPAKSGYHRIYFKGRHYPDIFRISLTTQKQSRSFPADLGNFNITSGLKKNNETIVGDPSFNLYALGKAMLENFSHQNLMALMEGFMKVVDPDNINHIQAPLSMVFNNIKGDGRKVLNEFYHTFPGLSIFLNRYTMLNSLLKIKKSQGIPYTHHNMKANLRLDLIQKDYPAIFDYLARMDQLFRYNFRLKQDDGLTIIEFKIEADKTKDMFTMSYYTRNGMVVPFDQEGRPVFEKEYSLTKLQDFKMKFEIDIYYYIYGLKFLTENIITQMHYHNTPSKMTMTANLKDIPRSQITGKAFHIVPTWSINFMIPGDIDQQLRKFTTTMLRANQGKGTNMKLILKMNPQRKNTLNILGTTELLDNFFIRLAFRIWQDKFKLNQAVLKEGFNGISKLLGVLLGDLQQSVLPEK